MICSGLSPQAAAHPIMVKGSRCGVRVGIAELQGMDQGSPLIRLWGPPLKTLTPLSYRKLAADRRVP